jgi:hypothetical protein
VLLSSQAGSGREEGAGRRRMRLAVGSGWEGTGRMGWQRVLAGGGATGDARGMEVQRGADDHMWDFFRARPNGADALGVSLQKKQGIIT